LEKKLGVGSFGEVWRCRVQEWTENDGKDASKHNNTLKAVKIVRAQGIDEARIEAMRMKRAVEAANPTHVPSFFFYGEGVRTEGDDATQIFGLCMEYVEGVSILDLLRNKQLSCLMAMTILQDLLVALGRLHDVGIIHCDVKSDNILAKTDGNCYLCDFGVSLFEEDFDENDSMPVAGTPVYMAPEMVREVRGKPARYDTKVDIWSAGMVGFEIALGYLPFRSEDGTMPIVHKIFKLLREIEGVSVEDIPVKHDYQGPRGRYAQFLTKCFQVVPEDRMSVPELFMAFPEFLMQEDTGNRTFLAGHVEACRKAQKAAAQQ